MNSLVEVQIGLMATYAVHMVFVMQDVKDLLDKSLETPKHFVTLKPCTLGEVPGIEVHTRSIEPDEGTKEIRRLALDRTKAMDRCGTVLSRYLLSIVLLEIGELFQLTCPLYISIVVLLVILTTWNFAVDLLTLSVDNEKGFILNRLGRMLIGRGI